MGMGPGTRKRLPNIKNKAHFRTNPRMLFPPTIFPPDRRKRRRIRRGLNAILRIRRVGNRLRQSDTKQSRAQLQRNRARVLSYSVGYTAYEELPRGIRLQS